MNFLILRGGSCELLIIETMEIQDVLKFADRLVFNHTGKHLDDLQTSIIEGVFQPIFCTTELYYDRLQDNIYLIYV